MFHLLRYLLVIYPGTNISTVTNQQKNKWCKIQFEHYCNKFTQFENYSDVNIVNLTVVILQVYQQLPFLGS